MSERPMVYGKTVLELRGVTKRYGQAGSPVSTEVLRDVSLRVVGGESVAIVGPSGSGKSTLLNIASGLDRPTAGEVFLEGQDLAGQSEGELAAIRNQRIGFVFQTHHLLPQCTIWENVLVPTLAGHGRVDRDEVELRAQILLDRVGLAERLDHRPGQLSGGEKQRVAVVRALINEPAILLADEPTGSLDRAASDNLAELLAELNREEGVTLVVVTHAPHVADCMARRLELRDGGLHEVPQSPPAGSAAAPDEAPSAPDHPAAEAGA